MKKQVWLITYDDTKICDTISIVFDSRKEAEQCFESLKKTNDVVHLDRVVLFNSFKQYQDDLDIKDRTQLIENKSCKYLLPCGKCDKNNERCSFICDGEIIKILEFQTIEHPYSCQSRIIECESWEKYKELLKDGKAGIPSYAHFTKDFEREESGLKHIHGYYINTGLNNALVHHNAFCWE